MADWISPDGFTDTQDKWSDEEKAYDGLTGTYTYVQQNGNGWCDYLQLDFSVKCTGVSKIRIWVSLAADADWTDFQVRVYDGIGGEELVIHATITEGQYVEANVSSCTTVAYAKIRFCGQTVKTGQQRVHEFQCYGEGGPAPPAPSVGGRPPSSIRPKTRYRHTLRL